MLVSNASVLRRAPPSLIVVAGLHLVALWALVNGLNIHSFTSPAKDMEGTVIDPVPPTKEPPPVADPQIREIKFTQPRVDPVVVDIQPLIEQAAPTITTPTPTIDQTPQGSAEPPVVVNRASVDPKHPLSQPAYPMEERRLGQEGRLLLAILVSADGRVSDAKVTQSSGSERLDQAAVKEARLHWRLRPATRNGVAFEQWLTVPVVFRLEDR